MGESLRERGWCLFDQIIESAPGRDTSPWALVEGRVTFVPDYDTLSKLLGVPVYLNATSQSGVPALALDVWVSYEMRRAGFDADKVWPRASEPRVFPYEIHAFVESLPAPVKKLVRERISGGKVAVNRPGFGGGCHSTRGWTAWQHHGSTRQSFKSARHVSRSKLAKIRNGDEEQYAGWPSSSV